MACPHGQNSTPDTCSQCKGARATVISRDAEGRLLVDGKVTERVVPKLPSSPDVGGPKARKGRCKTCKRYGHKTQDCKVN